jgi:hypothetical protein
MVSRSRVHATVHLMAGRHRREQLPSGAIELDMVSWVYAAVGRRSEQVPRGAVGVVRGRHAEHDVDAAILGVVVL